MNKGFCFLIVFLTLNIFCFQSKGQNLLNSYYFFENINSKKYIIILPGSSGLNIFGDTTFYFQRAKALQSEGYKVILIDYKKFYKQSKDLNKPKGNIGDKIAWVVKQVLLQLKEQKLIDEKNDGHCLSWSLGGEGLLRLAKDTTWINQNNIKSFALYYPSNLNNITINSPISMLIQMGELDNVVKSKYWEAMVEHKEKINLMVYKEAHHGFDIESILKTKTIKFPPFFGKKYIFCYNQSAALQAQKALLDFLKQSESVRK